MTFYLKYQIKYSLILAVLQKLNKRKINFFIDLQNISRGFYNRNTIFMEINRFATENKISNIFIEELKFFLNNLFMKFKQFDPFFIIFYDDGRCQQNKNIQSYYKNGRNTLNTILEHDEELHIFRKIKQYYFNQIQILFEKEDLSKVFYLKQYEADLIPHYCILNDLFDSQQNDILNVILSVDKDLLQTCKFTNTIQCATNFHGSQSGKKQIHFGVYDNDNCISYIYKNFKPGILTAKYIPLILSLTGDKADGINGIKNIGPAKAIKLIEEYRLPHKLDKNDINNYPEIIQDNFDLIQSNFSIIDFEEQIKRIPKESLGGQI